MSPVFLFIGFVGYTMFCLSTMSRLNKLEQEIVALRTEMVHLRNDG